MKLRTSEVEQLQLDWIETGKVCNHNQGWGIEQDDATGCKCDCFCVKCVMRNSEDFFEQRMKVRGETDGTK